MELVYFFEFKPKFIICGVATKAIFMGEKCTGGLVRSLADLYKDISIEEGFTGERWIEEVVGWLIYFLTRLLLSLLNALNTRGRGSKCHHFA